MGRDNPGEITSIGHIQHCLLSSDYLIYPNDYMMDKMMNSYMIEKIYPGNVLLEGYPRNSVFFKKSDLRNRLGLDDKEIFVYMPTYRGSVNDKNDEDQKRDIEGFLEAIDSNLNDSQLMLVKLHPYNESQIDFSKFNNVRQFPEGFESYDVINMADCLITDYSSVFFDFANTMRKIIIFNYDEDEYLKERGIYFPLSDLPYPKVSSVDGLIGELNLNKDYDDSDFVAEFCRYDNPDAVKNICGHIFKNSNSCMVKDNFRKDNNILVYAGSLEDGMIDNIKNILNSPDYNFFITFRQWDGYILQNHAHILEKIPEGVEFLPFRYNLTPTFNEKKDYNRYFKSDKEKFPASLHNLFKRTYDKQFGCLKFRAVIDFDVTNLNESFIFTHSNAGEKIAVCENVPDLSNKMIDILKGFDAVVVSSDESRLYLSDYIDENKIKLINEWSI